MEKNMKLIIFRKETIKDWLLRSSANYVFCFYLFICLFCFVYYRIIAMCGDYYIGGRRFSSLSDLIGYYSHVSCLLKGEKLLYPVAPPEVSKTHMIHHNF